MILGLIPLDVSPGRFVFDIGPTCSPILDYPCEMDYISLESRIVGW